MSSSEREYVGSRNIGRNVLQELWRSSSLLFYNKISWLLLLGPVALIGDSTKIMGEAFCFALSGMALIPCAERLSFVTEQVAEHTNGTIGALLNATFGNAPELLIATAALRAGYYRVVQLAMLGSMLTNLLFVFGMACLVGGLRWQVQELRITSGNVNVGLLLLSVAGSLLPAALVISGQIQGDETSSDSLPSKQELRFSRVNAVIMVFMYGCFLVFQLGTHKQEFEDDDNTVTTPNGNPITPGPQLAIQREKKVLSGRNMFCLRLWGRFSRRNYQPTLSCIGDVELSNTSNAYDNIDLPNGVSREFCLDDTKSSMSSDSSSNSSGNKLLPHNEVTRDTSVHNHYFDDYYKETENSPRGKTEPTGSNSRQGKEPNGLLPGTTVRKNKKDCRPMLPLGLASPSEEPPPRELTHEPQISFRVGIFWLFIITIGISALSDILVHTIHGFASRFEISEVFASMVIVPFFSNVAEQVSAILFAYRNEMDLCVGVTVGSAIQVATFVLPGCVIIGMFVDRSMTLFFHAYETVCLFLAVIVVAAVLQGGTTNWLVGLTMVGIYVMIAVGFWFHELEDLSVDAENIGDINATMNP